MTSREGFSFTQTWHKPINLSWFPVSRYSEGSASPSCCDHPYPSHGSPRLAKWAMAPRGRDGLYVFWSNQRDSKIPTEMDWLQQILFGFEWWGWCRKKLQKLQKLHGKLEFEFTVEIHVSHFESRCIWGANALPFLVMHLVVGISVDETFTGVAKTNWSFEVVFVIAPQKRRQGIDIDGSIPAGFFLSIFLLAIQASLLYLGWSVFHFRIFTFCQFINMKISPQWL